MAVLVNLKEENHEEVPFHGTGSGNDPFSGRCRRKRKELHGQQQDQL
jgi:hypothetical protein